MKHRSDEYNKFWNAVFIVFVVGGTFGYVIARIGG